MGYGSYSSIVFRCCKLGHLFFKSCKLLFICFFQLVPLLFYPEETYSYKESNNKTFNHYHISIAIIQGAKSLLKITIKLIYLFRCILSIWKEKVAFLSSKSSLKYLNFFLFTCTISRFIS